MTRPRIEWFTAPDGSLRELTDPDGPPTGRQLQWLNAHGLLILVSEAGLPPVRPLTKAEAAAEIAAWRTDA